MLFCIHHGVTEITEEGTLLSVGRGRQTKAPIPFGANSVLPSVANQ